jgi:hypothetical protein
MYRSSRLRGVVFLGYENARLGAAYRLGFAGIATYCHSDEYDNQHAQMNVGLLATHASRIAADIAPSSTMVFRGD